MENPKAGLDPTEDAPYAYIAYFRDQIHLLGEWNKENISKEPEQVRKNLETMICAWIAIMS